MRARHYTGHSHALEQRVDSRCDRVVSTPERNPNPTPKQWQSGCAARLTHTRI